MSQRLEKVMMSYSRARLTEAASSLELARLEHQIWELMKAKHGKKVTKQVGERRDWMQKQFGGNTTTYDHRANIYNAGKWAHVLFEKIDSKELPLAHASLIAAHVKAGVKMYIGIKPKVFMEQILTEYRGTPNSITTIKWKPGSRKNQVNAESIPPASVVAHSRQLKIEVNRLAEAYMARTMESVEKDLDPYLRDKILENFKLSIDQTVDEFRREIETYKRDIKRRAQPVGKRRFDLACEVLSFNGTYGKPIDIKEVARKMRIRARDLHPDVNPSPEAKKEYLAVTDAFSVLQEYARSTNGKANDRKG